MKRFLVTGVNGFVGQHLAKELASNGIEVVGIGGPIGSTINPENVLEYHALDLSDPEAASSIDFGDIDSVVHLAGLAAVGPSFDDPIGYVRTNVGLEVNLFEAALKQNKKPRFLIISTGGLYDPKAPLPLTETSATIPSSPYAVSKLGQEQMAQYYAGRGFEVVIARPFNHIGPGQAPGFIVPDLTQQIVNVERGTATEIKVGNLDAKRDYTDVRDIARAYRLILESGRSGEIYNICSGASRSGNDLLSLLIEAARITPQITQDAAKMRPSDSPDIFGSHKKLTDDTGWQPAIPIEQTLEDVLADWRNRPQ